MDTIKDILDAQVLTSSYRRKPAARPTPLTEAFYVNPEEVEGDRYELFVDPAEARPAPLNASGSEIYCPA